MADEDSTCNLISKEEAEDSGLKFYFTGKPCAYGHIAPRHVCNRTCIECAKIHDRRQKDRNADARRKAERQRYWENPEKFREKTRRYKMENKDKTLSALRRWRRTNKEAVKQYNAEWRRNNPAAASVHANNRRARVRNVGGFITKKDVADLLESQRGRCTYCSKKVGDNFHVDHIIPVSKGGQNSKGNIQICCPTCNQRKHAKDPIDFAQELGLLI